MIYNADAELYAEQVAINASNIKAGTNPAYALSDFYAVYPQFGMDAKSNYIVPQIVTQMFIDLADASIKETRWHSYWQVATGWFIAHFCTLYLQGIADPNSGANAVMEAGKTRGLDTSQSVGDVSVGTDYSIIANGLEGWANFLSTVYGTQLATIGRLMGKGGLTVR